MTIGAPGQAGRGGGGAMGGHGNTRSGERDAAMGGGGNGGGLGGAGIGGQMHVNRNRAIADFSARTGAGLGQIGNTGRTEAGLGNDVLGGMQRDYNNEGSSFIDRLGNFLASTFGFNEQSPTSKAALDRVRGTADPTVNGLDNRANWGFDPITGLASAIGMGFGVPGMGMIGDQISSSLGRPLEIGMGSDVFGGDLNPSQPGVLGGPADTTASGYPGMTNAQLSRSLSYLSGKPVNASTLGGGTQTSGTTSSMVGSNAGAYDPLSSFGGPSSAVAAARSPFNNQIGGLTAGGYAMGGKGKKSTPTQLAEGLGRFGAGAGHSGFQ